MKRDYKAVIQQGEKHWIGWIEEVPGVNSQGVTRGALMDNLESALAEMLEMNRADAPAACGEGALEEVGVPA
jgi:predicted RNase H-like HicB family nuclease